MVFTHFTWSLTTLCGLKPLYVVFTHFIWSFIIWSYPTSYGHTLTAKRNIGFSYLFFIPTVNLSTEVTNKLRIYQEHFESRYISCAIEFYTIHGQAHLSENGVQNYMKYVSVLFPVTYFLFYVFPPSLHHFLSFSPSLPSLLPLSLLPPPSPSLPSLQARNKLVEEERRANKYLETRKGCNSVQLLKDACDKVLVSDHKGTIVAECPKLVSANEVKSKRLPHFDESDKEFFF